MGATPRPAALARHLSCLRRSDLRRDHLRHNERLGTVSTDPQTILILLNVDLVLLLSLGALVASQLVKLLIERRRGAAGARLHTRMAALFSLVALTPTIVVAVFSALFLHFGMQSWFSEKVSSAINRSQVVAHTYVQEQGNNIRISTLAAAMELNGQAFTSCAGHNLCPDC